MRYLIIKMILLLHDKKKILFLKVCLFIYLNLIISIDKELNKIIQIYFLVFIFKKITNFSNLLNF